MNKAIESTISLKELREQFPKYIEAVSKGSSFTVVKRSKPIFQINPIKDEGSWTTIVDFTAIDRNGIAADDILEALK
ncbi:MAG: type II toxin-antitoxin system Phd/YefM family antitoxin [Rhabdochlamydiaceae bacterium]